MIRLSMAFALILLWCTGCQTTATLYTLSVAVDPAIAEPLDLSGEALIFQDQGIWGAILPLDFNQLGNPADLDKAWDFPNPLAGLYEPYHEPILFYLIMENRSGLPLTFNTSASFALTFEGLPLFPIEYDNLYQDLYQRSDGGPRIENIKRLLFKNRGTLLPGEHARGLLLFRRPDPGKREAKPLIFRIKRLHLGKDEVNFILPFRLTMEKIEPAKPDPEDGNRMHGRPSPRPAS
ncbi:MAG: hypothetical protein R3231_03980 [bacterium]|nr:hypothetical protein [bacterium]